MKFIYDNGGIIGKTMSIVDDTSYTLESPGAITTTLLLNGNGTNGAQNNTFVDNSTNNFTVTRTGNTTQGSFSPYGDLWSNYFDGTGDFLSVPSNAAFSFGSGDLTIECWVYLTAYSSTGDVGIICADPSVSTRNFRFMLSGTASSYSGLSLLQFYSGSSFESSSQSYSFSLGTWYHIALTKSSGVVRMFVGGTQIGNNVTFTQSQTASNATVSIGALNYTGEPRNLPGYISNLRIVKGTAVYTANFTPPTSPLTAITNTSLLTCQSNRFRDNSSNNFAITRNGDVSVQRFSPFSPSAEYSTSVIGGSGYFDGTGDFLSIASNSAFDLTGDFTFEAWVYLNTITGTQVVAARQGTIGGDGLYQFRVDGSQFQFVICANGSTSVTTVASTSNTISIRIWTHIAAVRSGSTITLYVNGSSVQTGTSGVSATSTTRPFTVGALNDVGPSAYVNGYISNFRFVKGTAVYTGNFTPPTAPVTAITNTSLLLNFTNGAIFDNAMINNLETVGNAQISTSVKKFGTGSLAFDGTGDYLVAPSTVNLTLGTGNFTIEFWLYLNAQGTYGIYDQRTALNQVLPAIYTSSGSIRYYVSGADRIIGSTLSASQWYHIALTKSDTSTRLFVNGTQSGSTYTDSNNYITSRLIIGTVGDAIGTLVLNGYIDDLRVVKGVALYTANFTPPVVELNLVADRVGSNNLKNSGIWSLSSVFDSIRFIKATGGTITTPGDGYRYHTFTTSGEFTITSLGNTTGTVEYLVVAGGGGGGGAAVSTFSGAGGGAGGMLTGSANVAVAVYTITVGGGGIAGSTSASGGNGGNSSISSVATAVGGGGASTTTGSSSATAAGNGGSGGGARLSGTSGGTGIAGQGFRGGNATVAGAGAGGGGASAAGANTVTSGVATKGGDGLEWPAASGTYYAGGGGGGGSSTANDRGGGLGGGGAAGVAGTVNTGGGGGGKAFSGSAGGGTAGGSGIVIIRYRIQ